MLRRLTILTVAAIVGFPLFTAGCAAVKPYEREYLALHIMDFNKELEEEAIERHWLETLEGSSGGLGGSGGGCACN